MCARRCSSTGSRRSRARQAPHDPRVAAQGRAPARPRWRCGPAPTPACSQRHARRSTSTSSTPRRPSSPRRWPRNCSAIVAVMLVRFGRSPKRALPFRTATPFPKMSASFEAPNGTIHKIEILGDGQQFICVGIHPDTSEPYTWHGGDATGHAARGARRGHRGGHADLPRARRRAAGGGVRLQARLHQRPRR